MNNFKYGDPIPLPVDLRHRKRESNERAARHFAAVLTQIGSLYDAGREGVSEAFTRFDTEVANIRRCQEWAATAFSADADNWAAAEMCQTFALAAGEVVGLRLGHAEEVRWLEICISASHRLGDESRRAWAFAILAEAKRAQGDTQGAKDALSSAHEGARCAGSRFTGALAGGFGVTALMLADSQQASLTLLEKSLALTRALGDRRGESDALGNLGTAALFRGNAQEALEYYKQQLNLLQAPDVGDPIREASALGNIGLAWNHLGRPDKAVEFHEQHLERAQELGHAPGIASALNNLGTAWADAGDDSKRIAYCNRAREIAQAAGDLWALKTALGNLGDGWLALGNHQQAAAFFEQALPVTRQTGDRHHEATVLRQLGRVWSEMGAPGKAIKYYEQAHELLGVLGDRLEEGVVMNNMGTEWSALGATQKAMECYEGALALARATNNRPGVGQVLGNFGTEYAKAGEYRRAAEFYADASKIAEETGEREDEAGLTLNLAIVLFADGSRNEAIAVIGRAISLFQAINSPQVETARRLLASWEQLG